MRERTQGPLKGNHQLDGFLGIIPSFPDEARLPAMPSFSPRMQQGKNSTETKRTRRAVSLGTKNRRHTFTNRETNTFVPMGNLTASNGLRDPSSCRESFSLEPHVQDGFTYWLEWIRQKGLGFE